MRSFAARGLVACLGMLAAGCASRALPAVPPALTVPPSAAAQAAPPGSPPASGPSSPEPPALLPAVTPPRSDAAGECALFADSGEPMATVAVSDRIDPANAPHPTNDGERLVFRQMYETLVRADCEGRVRPGLAASWHLDASDTWIVTLRDTARFSDGTPVTTADVLSSWMSATGGNAGDLRPEVSRYVESIRTVDDRALAITLRSKGMETPLTLADTNLAIAKRLPGSVWPLGTRARRIDPAEQTPRPTGRSVITVVGDGGAAVRFLVDPGRDGRDFLDEGVDLLITQDRGALDYAATLPQFLSVPLAWQRVHVLLSPWRARSSSPLSVEARQSLADEAVRGEARGATDPFWWQGLPSCDVPAPRSPGLPPPATTRIVYERGDEAARDLAERLVGLGSYQRSIGLTGDALASAQERGTEAGYIISLTRRPLDPCQELREAVERLKWLDPETIVPLVDTRRRAVARRGRAGVIAEWDGGLVIP